MKINHSSPILAPTTTPSSEAKPKTPEKPAGIELPSVTARKALQESTDVDMDKVQRVREAIARGELVLDPTVLAEAVVDLHK